MPKYSYKGLKPTIGKGVYLAPSVDLIGDVVIGDDASVWHGCVLRGDVHRITIGARTNVQDLSMLHVTKDSPLIIGDEVSIGHSVTLHGCIIGNNCLIGMGATVLDWAEIGENSVVGAGSLVPPNKKFPPYSLIMGNPAVVKRELTKEEREAYGNHFKSYVGYKEEFLDPNIVQLIEE